MAGEVGIEIKADTSKIREKIAGVRSRLNDLRPVMQGRAAAFQTMTKRDVFNREQSPLGNKWDALADSTAKRKGSDKILTDNGFLQNAVHSFGTKSGIRVGVSGAPATHAGTHQYGHVFNRMSRAGKPYQQKVPRRPFLPLDEAGIVVATSGPMKAFMSRMARRVKDFILTGKL